MQKFHSCMIFLLFVGKLSWLYSNSKHLIIIRKKKFAGKPLRLEANLRKPQKFSTANNLHYTVDLRFLYKMVSLIGYTYCAFIPCMHIIIINTGPYVEILKGVLVWPSRHAKKIVIFQYSKYAWMKVSANNGTHNHATAPKQSGYNTTVHIANYCLFSRWWQLCMYE